MGFAETITHRPRLVIAVWIVVALVSFPLFISLHKVVKEQMYTLPESAESMKAQKLMKSLPAGNETNIGLVIVDGVDLSSNKTLYELARWSVELNKSVTGKYVSRITSFPLILAEINKTLYNRMLAVVNGSAQGALKLYETLESLDKAYAGALNNATKQVGELNKTVEAIVAADRGYVEAYKGLISLRDALNKTIAGLVALDKAYAEAAARLRGLAANMSRIAKSLQLLDSQYAGLYQNITGAAKQLSALLGNQSLVTSVEKSISTTWWQVSRTYYYMEAFGGNYTAYARIANLSAVNPSLAPLPEEQAVAVWRLVQAYVNKTHDLDEAALLATYQMLRSNTGNGLATLLPVFINAWNQSLVAYRAEKNITSLVSLYSVEDAARSQLAVLNASLAIGVGAANRLVSRHAAVAAALLAEQLAEKGVPESIAVDIAQKAVAGKLAPGDIAALVATLAAKKQGLGSKEATLLAKALSLYDPGANASIARDWGRAVEAAAWFLKSMGAPSDAVDAVAEALTKDGLDREKLARIAARILGEKLSEEAAGLLPVVEKADPRAEGVIASNKTLAARLAAGIVYEEATRQGKKLDKALVEKLALLIAQGDAGNDSLRQMALDMVAEEAKKKQGEEAGKTIASILAKYDPDASGRLASNHSLALMAVYELAKSQGRRIPFSLEQLEEAMKNPDVIRSLVARMFVNMSAEKAPKEMRKLVARLAEIVVEKGPGIPVEEKWRIVEQLLEEKAAKTTQPGMKMPSWFSRELAKWAVLVARGEASLQEAARQLAEKLLFSSILPDLMKESIGRMVSRDRKAFTLILVPLGSTNEDRAANIEKVAEEAKKLLERRGLEPRIYVSGEDIVMKQVRDYAIKDAEKTSRLSELGVFLVLLVLLESVFAVLLPYIGIILGLAVGGAIVYIAASHGVIDFSSHTQSIMITTALGLGADYAGYLIYRFKEEYAHTNDPREAARRSLKRAGPAIVASALTVIIGFGSLLLAWDISFLRGFGEAIPIAVAATATATLTLIPALLAIVGGRRWFWWPRRPRREKFVEKESRVMRFLVRHEKPVLAAMIALILVAGYFYANFEGSHDMKLMLPSNAPAVKAFDVLNMKFEPGITDPVFIVVETPQSIWSSNESWGLLEGLVKEIAGIKGVATVIAPTQPMGRPVANATEALEAGAKSLTSSDGRLSLIQVILGVYPYSKQGTKVIREIHSIVHQYAEEHGLVVYMDGSPYATLEMDDILTSEFYHRVLPGASLLMILTFTLIFGGLWVSISALIVIIGAAMTGIMASTLLFKYIFGKEMLWFMHIVTLAAVMGVGMDYNSFFLARALEECHKTGCKPKESVIKAAGIVSPFIVGLSLVVTVAYATMLTANNTGMREMGFALATTVFTAALMASYLLTPLVVTILGKHAWWPWGLKKRVEH